MSEGYFDCISMKKNEISGQCMAFSKKNYEHKYYDGDEELPDKIEPKHEKFRKVTKKFVKEKDYPGNQTAYWCEKLQSATITGIDENNQLLFKTSEDTEESLKKFNKIDIALKKIYNVNTHDKNDKKIISLMAEEEAKEILADCPDLVLRNPLKGLKSSYAEVMKTFLSMVKAYNEGERDGSATEKLIEKQEDVKEFLIKELHKSKVFYGGFLPPVKENTDSPLGIDIEAFLEYWEELT